MTTLQIIDRLLDVADKSTIKGGYIRSGYTLCIVGPCSSPTSPLLDVYERILIEQTYLQMKHSFLGAEENEKSRRVYQRNGGGPLSNCKVHTRSHERKILRYSGRRLTGQNIYITRRGDIFIFE